MRSSRGTTLTLDGRSSAESPLLGLEHEFQVWRGAEQIDFRTIVGALAVDGRRIDASDRHAYRCSWGGVITADGREAEIAVAPVECGPGFVADLHGRAALAHRSLRDALPQPLSLRGYSTHLSVATPTRLTSRVASIYAQRFAAPMMMLLDRRDSPGLLVRTRPGRIELCGEYATGSALRGATAFAAGSVLASIQAVDDHRYRRHLPPVIDVTLAPAAQRTGWFVDRCSFGTDLYAAGRVARLRGRRGTTTAQHQLEAAWTVARAALNGAGLAHDDDLAATNRMVAGLAPLPIESESHDESPPTEHRSPSAFGDAIADRVRDWGRISAAVMSWDVVIFAVVGARTSFAAVPRCELGVFLADLDAGRLDDAIGRYLASPPNGSRLVSAADVERASLYDEVSADHIAPNEPRPGAPLGRIKTIIDRAQGANGGGNSRDNKNRREDRSRQPDSNPSPPEPSPPQTSLAPRALKHALKTSHGLVAAGAALALVVLVAAVAMASGGDEPPSAAAATTTTVAGAPGGSTNSPVGPGTPSTTRGTTAARYKAVQGLMSAEQAWTRGACDNGATPGKMMVFTAPSRFTTSNTYADPPPPGVTAYEMTWVGGDRYEVRFPEGAVRIGTTGLEVVADCSGATTRKSGKSVMTYQHGSENENGNGGNDPFVNIKVTIEPGFDSCASLDQVVDPKVVWATIPENSSADFWKIDAEEPLQRISDGVYRVSIDTDRYNELMEDHSQFSTYRCNWGNG